MAPRQNRRRRRRRARGSSYILTAYNQTYVPPMSHIDFGYGELELPSDRGFAPLSIRMEVTAIGDTANPSGAAVVQLRGYAPYVVGAATNDVAYSAIKLCPTSKTTVVTMQFPRNDIWGQAVDGKKVFSVYNSCLSSKYHGLGVAINLTFRARILADVDDRTCTATVVYDGPPPTPPDESHAT